MRTDMRGKEMKKKTPHNKSRHKDCAGCSYLKDSYMCFLDNPSYISKDDIVIICPCVICLVKGICIYSCDFFLKFASEYIGDNLSSDPMIYPTSTGGSSGPSTSSSSHEITPNYSKWMDKYSKRRHSYEKHENRNRAKESVKGKPIRPPISMF